EVIKAYIHRGGSVFLVGLGWTWTKYIDKDIDQYPLNQVANDFGIFFTANFIGGNDAGPIIHGRTMMNTEHPITKGVTWVSTDKGANAGTFRIVDPAVPIIWGDEQTHRTNGLQRPPVVVAAEVPGGGRLVGIQHPDYVLNHLDDTILVENIVHWLVHLP
ncbi:MAG: hypothetical protein ABIV47_01150, partial [Roseiflexaceae bacterium]